MELPVIMQQTAFKLEAKETQIHIRNGRYVKVNTNIMFFPLFFEKTYGSLEQNYSIVW